MTGRRIGWLTGFAAVAVFGMVLVFAVGAAFADAQHGISFTKGCESPTPINAPYKCSYSVRNIVDDSGDTLTINGLEDTVHAASGNVSSGNVFNSLRFEIAAGSPTCTGGTGDGSPGNPFTGASFCTLPAGSRLNVQSYSFYTVQPQDFNLEDHVLSDSAVLDWADTCDHSQTSDSNCSKTPPAVGAGSQSTVQKLPSTTTTDIHKGNVHTPVLVVEAGSTVHDFVSVSGGSGNTTPTGNVNIDWFTNGTCSGAPAQNSGSIGPLVNGQFDATGFAFTVDSAGQRSFKAHYEGSGTYLASDGACEPLSVVDANIQIAPATATNAVGTNHVLTITVNAINGTIDAGPHTATASIVSGPGSFAGSSTCTYTGGGASASCTVTITSAAPGTTVVSATSGIPVSGQTVTRTTNTTVNASAGGSGNASKTWVNANIQITPPSAVNPVSTNHVLTITVNAINGTIDAGPHTATASIVSGPGSFAGSPSCTYTGGGATASCTVTITSAVTGTTIVSATSSIPVNGQTIVRTTDTPVNTTAGGSGNASKFWADSEIVTHVRNAVNADITNTAVAPGTIVHDEATVTKTSGTPAGAPNPTGTVTFRLYASGTCNGTLVATDANRPLSGGTATSLNFTTPSAGGSFSYLAHYNGDANYPGRDAACEPFSVTAVDAKIDISPATANNPVGTNHVLTITVTAINGTIDPGPHTATASIVSGPGAFAGSPSCTYTGGAATASCTVTITSATAGTTLVSATSNIPVNGQAVTRTTGTAGNTAAGGSGNAAKNWADSTIVTHVRNATNADVTNLTVPSGTVVHDEATVGKTATTPAGVPAPTGTVTFTLYASGTCTGTVLATDANKPLSGGTATSVNFTTPAGGGSFSYRAHYNGDANYPGHDAVCEPFSVEQPPSGLITETNVACGDVLSGAAQNSVIGAITYPSSGGKIGQGINPGKFYYWTKITTTVPNQVVTVTQANSSTNSAALFGIHQGWARVYTGNCATWTDGTQINGGTGATFTVPTPGSYFIGIKYDPKTLAGTKVPVPATVTYSFTTTLGGNTGASVTLRPS